jgi:NADH-quinone oxidoreductase subunit G
VVLKRMGAVYSIDERSVIRKSHENASVRRLYQDFLGQPGSPLAHELLHTRYTDRSTATLPAHPIFEHADERLQGA